MERASRVMYTIANIFNWIALVLAVFLVVSGILYVANVQDFMKVVTVDSPWFNIVYGVLMFLVCLAIITLVRIAKAKGSSKGWDILFIVMGAVTWNPFYILGGIFGLVAPRK